MDVLRNARFNCAKYLATTGVGRRLAHYKAKTAIFVQGGVADSVFYLQSGRAKLTVVSERGKEATVTLLAPGYFMGEEALAGIEKLVNEIGLDSHAAFQHKLQEEIGERRLLM